MSSKWKTFGSIALIAGAVTLGTGVAHAQPEVTDPNTTIIERTTDAVKEGQQKTTDQDNLNADAFTR
ncbi:hypothetical protein H0264_20630 [Nocardia huaxiensis]|uniref:Uncharacterized protein n=1 Tax=Nocardia huaxiensis TaxID=2755382 RepID=A0A7D6V775_9NOCA|nr:hypothetical protein [Nocardia huaxiensis]QLY27853.1 hypothetical protein H0264_20630 [Nocardia huaxiensis]